MPFNWHCWLALSFVIESSQRCKLVLRCLVSSGDRLSLFHQGASNSYFLPINLSKTSFRMRIALPTRNISISPVLMRRRIVSLLTCKSFAASAIVKLSCSLIDSSRSFTYSMPEYASICKCLYRMTVRASVLKWTYDFTLAVKIALYRISLCNFYHYWNI
jgi:hypothetical protein